LVKEIYTYPVWQFKRLDYYDATGGEIELIDYLLEKFEKVNPATVLWYISHFPQNVDKGKALADALIAEKFEYIDNPEGFLRSKIAFNQKKELKFRALTPFKGCYCLLDARVQKLIRNLLEEIKEELNQKGKVKPIPKEEQITNLQPPIEEQEPDQKEEPSYLEYEPDNLRLSLFDVNPGSELVSISYHWSRLSDGEKEEFYKNWLKKHPLLEEFIKNNYPSLEALDEDLNKIYDVYRDEKKLLWPKVQILRFYNLFKAFLNRFSEDWSASGNSELSIISD